MVSTAKNDTEDRTQLDKEDVDSEEKTDLVDGIKLAINDSLTVMQMVALCVLVLVSLAMVAWYMKMQKQRRFTYRLAEKHAGLPYWRV